MKSKLEKSRMTRLVKSQSMKCLSLRISFQLPSAPLLPAQSVSTNRISGLGDFGPKGLDGSFVLLCQTHPLCCSRT